MMSLSLMVPVALMLAVWNRVSLRFAAGPETDPGLIGAALSALAGSMGVLVVIRVAPVPVPIETELALCLFGALLLITGWTDHRTAWAPDGVVVPLLVCGALSASLIGPFLVGPLTAFAIAALIFCAAQGGWALQGISGRRVLPPPDLIALSLPVLLFGLTPYTFLTYLLLSGLLILVLRAPDPLYRIIRGPAATDAVEEAGLTGSGRSAPFLPMSLGALYGVLLLRLFQG